jgi:hypothetical protein
VATGDIVTTINASTVSGGDDGIRNETGGDVALGVTNGSSVTGAAGDGIDIDAGGNALVVVNASTVTGADEGIIADAGGTVGIAVLNGSAVTGTAGDGIDALAGTNVGVVVSASAVEGGEDGISALAGGSVGIAVLNGSTVTGNGSNGIDGSAGGNIGLLVNASDVQGNGYGAILNAGGSVVIAALNGSSIIGTGADGIEAVAGTNAFIVLNDSTVEGGANGILTNAGGNIGIAVLNGSSVDGNAGDGIEAVAGGAIGVGVSDSTVEGGVNGIFADAGGAITIGVVSGGTVTGTAEDGIRTIGDNAPTVILVNASTVTGGDDGIDATALAGAISTAVIGGTVTGANLATGFGIVQASAGNQLVVADDGSRVTGGTGISASTTGLASTVTVVVADNSFVNGTVLDGVATNAVNGTTTITVANAKIADLPNPQNGNGLRGAQDGIDARASGTGEIDITLANADVRGVAGAAIKALGTGGEITIAIDDASTAIGATGVRFGSNGATSTLTNDGVIRATGAGALDGAVVTVGTAASVNRVINTGLIETTSLATVPSLFNQGGTILFDNDAGGVLNGHVEALAGTTSIFDNNPGAIWNFQGAGTLAGNETVNNSGTFNIVNGGGTMTGLETFNNFGAGRVNFGTQATPASGSLTGIGVFNNDSIIYAAGSQGAPLAATLGVAQFNNQDQGIIRLTKDVTAPGFGVNYDPTNAANNSTADQFTITGNYTGTAGSLLEVDLDLTRTTDAGGLRADR